VALDFVRHVEVRGADVRVELRLPTYWCAPNFAYLMLSDARAAVRALPGVERVRVELAEHFAAGAVTEGVNAELPFPEAFPDHADGGLGELRRRFRLKAFVVRQEPVLRAVRGALGDAEACALTLGDGRPPPGADPLEWREYLDRRRDLGMDEAPSALAFTDAQGRPLEPGALRDHLRLSRSVRVSLQSNTEFCTGLLAARYGDGLEEWRRGEVAA
jgi:hypothetical protein